MTQYRSPLFGRENRLKKENSIIEKELGDIFFMFEKIEGKIGEQHTIKNEFRLR